MDPIKTDTTTREVTETETVVTAPGQETVVPEVPSTETPAVPAE